MSNVLFRAIVGAVMPRRVEDILDVPAPYRATVMQSRSLKKQKGSQSGEPGEAEKPITENPTP